MIGWPVLALCFDACWFGELSQQPMWPHSAHRRRCSPHPSVARHSTQPVPLGFTFKLIPSRSLFMLPTPPRLTKSCQLLARCLVVQQYFGSWCPPIEFCALRVAGILFRVI